MGLVRSVKNKCRSYASVSVISPRFCMVTLLTDGYRGGELYRLEQPVGKQSSYGRGLEHASEL